MVWGRIARNLPPNTFKLEFPIWPGQPGRAKPIEPPLGVGPTAEIFGPLGPPGAPPAPRRSGNVYVEPPPATPVEPVAPEPRARRVAPVPTEIEPLLYRLGYTPPDLSRTSQYASGRTTPPRVYKEGIVFKGRDEAGNAIWEPGTVSHSAAPWNLEDSIRANFIENILKRGKDYRGRSIDAPAYGPDGELIHTGTTLRRRRWSDLTPQQRLEGVVDGRPASAVVGEFEVVTIRKALEEELARLRKGTTRAPSWWLREQKSGKAFDQQFNALAVRDPATGDRVQVELLDNLGNKMVFPTKAIDPNDSKQVFVFGSNLKGVHGAGAAKTAKVQWGAQDGVGSGPTGRAYAIPTKRTPTRDTRQMEVYEVENYIEEFFDYARANPDFDFMFTPVGTGLGGYELDELATIIARHAYRDGMPGNIYFVDVNEKATDGFIAAIARARGKVKESFVEVDVDDLIKLEQEFFGARAIKPQKVSKDIELFNKPAPEILRYADTSAKEITSGISRLIEQTVKSGNIDDARVLQAYILRRLEAARTPRAIVTALKDYKALAPTVSRRGPMSVGFRDAVEQAMENLGYINKRVAADTYVYLAEEVVDARKLVGYIEGYIDNASGFADLLRARYWLDDAFIASKLSHPELLARDYWSRAESRLVSKIEKRIETLRAQHKRYLKPEGVDSVDISSTMSDEQIRDMFVEAIGTARSLDELRVLNGMAVASNLPENLYDDIAVSIRAIRPIVSARRARPTRTGERMLTETDSGRLAVKDQRRWGIVEEGDEFAFKYEPYNPETMLSKATETQQKWIREHSADAVRAIRNTMDIDELRDMYRSIVLLKQEGKLSGRMWKLLEKDMNARASSLAAYYKRSGLLPKSALPDAEDAQKIADIENLKAWAQSASGARRGATRYWNDPDIARRDDLSDFVEFNPAYEELIHDSNMRDAAAGRRARAYEGSPDLQDPFHSFDDKLGQVSVLRGDISEEIVGSVNRKVWEARRMSDLIDSYIARGYDALDRPLDSLVDVVRKVDGKERTVQVTVRENLEFKKDALARDIARAQTDDAVWRGENESALPFGTRRIVNPVDPTESRLEAWDWRFGFWFPADAGTVASRRASNKARENLSAAIFPDPEDITLVYESAGRVGVSAAGDEFVQRPLIRFFVPDGHGYAYRTYINASGSDVTVSVAANFDSPGEKLTRRFANGGTLRWDIKKQKYVAASGKGKYTKFVDIPHNADDFEQQVRRLVDQLNETYRLKGDNPITVNFAGNALGNLGADGQAAADAYAFRLMRAAMEHPRRNFVIANARSGGQNGYDEAFMKAMLRLDIPIDVTLPRARFGDKVMVQDINGETIYPTVQEYLQRIGARETPITTTLKPARDPHAVVESIPGKGKSWGQFSGDSPGFEVSTRGTTEGKRFSAFNARIKARGNKSIEDIYQIDIKGGEKIGPGRYSKKGPGYDGPLSYDELYAQYKQLWREWFNENPQRLQEIAQLTEGKMITDQFARSDISQARAIFEILEEAGMWRGLRGASDAARSAAGAKVSMPMYFKDGTRGLRMSPEHRGKSTMDLIIEGKRTGTTRGSLNQFKGPDGKTLRVGDVVEFTDNAGKTVQVEITKAPYRLPVSDDPAEMARYAQRWSELEGWDPAMYSQYAGQYQMQYKLVK